MGPDILERGIDLLTPIWHFLDLTPQGRGSWYASLNYGNKSTSLPRSFIFGLVDAQVAPAETDTPSLYRSTIVHERLRMEGWRQRRLG